MAKWFGKIGYAFTGETEAGLWEEDVIEKDYYGDMTSDRRKRQASEKINDNLTLANVISVIADPFAYENCSNIAYVEVMGARWKVSDVEVQYPRLILTVGGVYNGNSPRVTE